VAKAATTTKVKKRVSQDLVDEINNIMGKGTMTLASDPYYKVDYLPTGISPIDDLLGGGIPYGRFIEIFGNYSTLKTYVGLRAIAMCQAKGELAALVDTEHSFDPKWAKECGVILDGPNGLVLKQPDSAEEAMDICEVLIRGGVNLIVFDSIAAALPRSERDTMLSGDKNIQPARLAALMSIAMRKLTTANKKTAMIWVNQTRVNVGMMFGNPETTPGGKSMGFYASQRLALRKAGSVVEPVEVYVTEKGSDGRPVPKKKKINQTVAVTIRATLEKSKLNQPHRDVQFNFDFRNAKIDEWWYIATQCLDVGAIEYNRGVWEVCEGKMKGQKFRGREGFQEKMTEEELLKLLNRKPPASALDNPSGGPVKPAKSKAASPSAKSSKPATRKSTPTRARAKSKTTGTTKTASTKSKTRRKVTRSARVR
jgi:recombination protein RecA